MPRSPYRRSPSYERGKRDYRHVQKSSQDRYYGGQSRKKVNRGSDYPERPREPQNDRRKDNYDNRIKSYDAYEQRPVIRIEPKEPVVVKSKEPQSEIKIHFRFRPLTIKLNSRGEEDLKQKLKTHISEKIGPVEYFEKSSDSYAGYLILELGFRYDRDAFSYLEGKFSQIDITVEKEKVYISAQPTRTFKLLIDEYNQKKKKAAKQVSKEKSRSRSSRGKKQKTKHKKKKSYSRDRSSSSSSSSRSKRSKGSRSKKQKGHKSKGNDDRSRKDYNVSSNKNVQKEDQRRQNGRRDYQRDYQRQVYPIQRPRQEYKPRIEQRIKQAQPQRIIQRLPRQQIQKQSIQTLQRSQTQLKQQSKQYTTLYFFGIHYSVNSKDMDNLFRNHSEGPFFHQELIWRQMKDSISVFLEGKFDRKHAQKLLEISDKLEVKGHPFVIVESDSMDVDVLLQKIAQYQINIQFPQKIEPYHLLKGMKQCGCVVQIVSNNKLTQQGRGQYYNVTFNSRQVCAKLKAIKKTSREIIIEQVTPENAVYIYRPNLKTELMTVDYVQTRQDYQDINASKDYKPFHDYKAPHDIKSNRSSKSRSNSRNRHRKIRNRGYPRDSSRSRSYD